MSHVAAYLAALDEEVQCGHPLVHAQAGLAREVVEVRHETGHEVREARIVALRVDAVGVVRDVVNRQVEEAGRSGGGHRGGCQGSRSGRL